MAEMSSEEDFSDLPEDLRKMTQCQQQGVVDFLAKKSLRELRRRQELTRMQIDLAFSQRNETALGSLQIMESLLGAAVGKREFGTKFI